MLQTPEELVEPIPAEERFTIELHREYTALSGALMIYRVLRPDVVGLLRVRLDVGDDFKRPKALPARSRRTRRSFWHRVTDPAFDIEYVYATYILERVENMGALVVNRPEGLRTANEKVFVSWFPECAPSTLVSRSVGDLNAFINEHERAVIKPLDRMAGKSVFVTGVDDPNRSVILETMTDFGDRFIMAQRYLPEVVRDGDARILLIDGKPIPSALVRYAPTGDHRANMSVGARTLVRSLTGAEQRICDQVGPVLRDMGLLFVGIDVISGYLTEINVTSPTGIRELDGACGSNIAAQLLEAIVSQLRDT